MTPRPEDDRIARLLRDLAPGVLGAVVRRYRDFGASEDATQEALIAAATQWPGGGVPEDPRAWLIHVASRRMADHARAEAARRRREAVVVSLVPPELQIALAADEEAATARDDTLVLLFMCCHPALSTASAIALTLRAVGGLTTAEIARSFLVPEATMAQRVSRAKATIQASSVPFQMPTPEETSARLGTVLHVLYLIFNEGYATSSGDALLRTDLSSEAIRLTRMLHARVPSDGDVEGLLALMILSDARRAARTGLLGELIPLDEQDRSLWDRAAIHEGALLVHEALSRAPIGAYALQAAIAAVHDEAPRAEDTDWAEILVLYAALRRISDSPMAALSHAVATAMVHGPAAGLLLLDALDADPRLTDHHRLFAVRAHLLERAGDREAALASYEQAADRTTSLAEQRYLITRAARLRGAGSS